MSAAFAARMRAEAYASVRVALEFMRDCGDRPGMHDRAERALEALETLDLLLSESTAPGVLPGAPNAKSGGAVSGGATTA